MFKWDVSKNKDIGNMLVDASKITSSQLNNALYICSRDEKSLEETLVQLDYIKENELVDFLSEALFICKVELSQCNIDEEVLRLIPKDIAQKYSAIPFKQEGNSILVAMSDPNNLFAIDDIKIITNKNIQPYIAKKTDIQLAINKYFGNETTNKAIEELEQEFKLEIHDQVDTNNINEIENAPTVRLANSILTQAIDVKASDIHIEPFENEVIVRYRIDGVLKDEMTIPKNFYSAVSTRIKIISGMDIAEKRLPQDGRIEMKVNRVPYDFRVNSLPTIYGEKIVMRILDRTGSIMERSKLGFTEKENEIIDKILKMPNGILLVTGPTGSGKTTTLYSFLDELNIPEENITTIEDPVEYMLPRVNQVQVNNKAGMTFAAGLRSMLRQDPDIIMIGEMRDEETAQIAVRASITGHFVLSTLHTNDAPSTITRLLDMGLEPYLVADAVKGIIAQRLIRKLCTKCKKKTLSTELENKILDLKESKYICNAVGCSECNNTGFKGRIALHEVLIMNGELKRVVEQNEGMEKIRQAGLNMDMVSLEQNCRDLVLNGETTVEEMVKIVNGAE